MQRSWLGGLLLSSLVVGCGSGETDPGGDTPGKRDTTAPTIVSVTPADMAQDVPVSTDIVIVFSEALDGSTVTPTSITLRDVATSSPVTATVTLASGGTEVTLAPSADLAPFVQYEIGAATSVTDEAGNALGTALAARFTTIDLAPPTTPGAPVDAGLWEDDVATLTWTAATDQGAGVSAYLIDVSTAQNPTGIVFTEMVGAVTTADLDVGAHESETLYFRVRARDAEGNLGVPSGWSDGITVDTTPPTVPLAPQDGGEVTGSLTLTFTWAASTDAASGVADYIGRLATDPAGTNIVDEGPIGTLLTTTVDVTVGQTYYAAIAAVDNAGNTSAFSGYSDGIFVDDSAPPAPAAPGDEGAFGDALLTFTWTAPADPQSTVTGFRVQIATSSDGQNVVSDLVTSQTSTTFTGTQGLTYYARVAATNEVGLTGAFSPFSDGIVVDLTVPTVGGAPSDAGTYDDLAITLTFSAPADAQSGVVGQTLTVYDADTGGTLATVSLSASATSTTYDASAHDGRRLAFAITATNGAGLSATTPRSNGIIVDGTGPAIAAAPTDGGAQTGNTSVDFQWQVAVETGSGTAYYEVQIARDATTNAPLSTTNTGLTRQITFTDPAGSNGHTYFARVRAVDALGNVGAYSPWSDGILVNTALPGTPGQPTDDGDYVDSPMLSFGWSTVTGAVEYHLVFTNAAGATICDTTTVTPPFVYTVASPPSGCTAQPNGTTFYLKVSARNATSDEGAFSLTSNGIMIDSTAPGLPGTPVDRGAVDDTQVTFSWVAAVDAESGVARYELRIESTALGFIAQENNITGTSFTFDANAYAGHTLIAQVTAVNRVGVSGPASNFSDGVVVDNQPPWITYTQPNDGGPLDLAADFVVYFSEAMDQASVEAAFALVDELGNEPRHGYDFAWSSPWQLVIAPNTQDPAALTNVDVLLPSHDYSLRIDGATDLAGNALPTYVTSYTTRDGTQPRLTSIVAASGRDALTQPLLVGDVTYGAALDLTFSEPMRRPWGDVWIYLDNGALGASASMVYLSNATGNGTTATYVTNGPHGLTTGDLVEIIDVLPAELNSGGRVAVTVIDGSTFQAPLPTASSATMTAPGIVLLPGRRQNGLALEWLDADTIRLTMLADVLLAPGRSYTLQLNNFSDPSFNYLDRGEVSLQVAPAADSVAPVVLDSIPRSGDVVPGLGRLVVSFSEPMDLATLDGVVVSGGGLSRADFNIVGGSRDNPSVFFLVPQRRLPAGTSITLTVPTSARDLFGNALAAPYTVTFTAAAPTTTAPVVSETWPPDGAVVSYVGRMDLVLHDGTSRNPDPLPAAAFDARDIEVVNEGTGRLVRGFGFEGFSSDYRAAVRSLPGTSGLSPNFTFGQVSSATGDGALVTYSTTAPHTLSVYDLVTVAGMQSGGSPATAFDVNAGSVVAVPDSTSFVVAGAASGTADSGSFWAQTAALYTVTVGAGHLVDGDGNALAPTSFSFTLGVGARNFAPTLYDAWNVYLSGSSSAAGRALELQLGAYDPNGDPVLVTAARGGYSISDTINGSGYVRLGGDGPPVGDPGMATGFDTSAYYTFDLSLDDGRGESTSVVTFQRDAFVWAPSDVPSADSIDGVAMSATAPLLVTSSRPTFAWSGVDVTNASMLQFFAVEVSGVEGSGVGYNLQHLLHPQATSMTFPASAPLGAGIYLWAVAQLKTAQLGDAPEGVAWSFDITGPMERALFIHGPGNSILDGNGFGMAQVGFTVADGEVGLDFAGLAAPDTGSSAPAFHGSFDFGATEVTYALTAHDATTQSSADPGPFLYAYDATSRDLVVTRRTGVSPFPVAGRGFGGRLSGSTPALISTASAQPDAVYLAVGGRRYATSGFSSASLNGTWSTAYFEVSQDTSTTPPTLQTAEAGYGTTTMSAGSFTFQRADNSAGQGPQTIASNYTVSADGFVQVQVAAGEFARGYIGGSGTPEIVTLATDVAAGDHVLFIVLVKQQSLTGQTAAVVNGAYRMTGIFVESDGAGGLRTAFDFWGEASFDGAGTMDFSASTREGAVAGVNDYAIVGNHLEVTAQDGVVLHLLGSGATYQTLVGVTVDSGEVAELVVLSK